MPRISAISSPIASSVVVVLTSLAFATPSLAEGTSDPCAGPFERYVVAPSGASLLALASCHEQRGKTASAWAEFLEAATLAHREKQHEVEAAAKQHAAALESHLSTLTVRVTPGWDTPGLDVHRDGVALERATWGTAAPVDPGEHRLEATAPGRLPWRRTLVVRPGPGAQSVEIGSLEDASATRTTTTLTSATMPGDDARPASDPGDRPRTASSAQRGLGLGAIGAGLVGLGLGSYFGIRTLDQRDAARRVCPTSPCPDRSAVEKNDQAKTSALVSTVSFAAGGGLVLLGSLLVVSAPSSSPRARAVRARTFDVAATPAFTGFHVGGDF